MRELKEWFKGKGKVAVAFSGGVDSSLVAAAAVMVLGNDSLAITVKTGFVKNSEVDQTKSIADRIGIRHMVIELPLPEEVLENPPERCYVCKKCIMSGIKETVLKEGFKTVVDGTNVDDLHVGRLGIRALKEEGIRSPLAELKIDKKMVREVSRVQGMEYDKPPNACMATRFPTGYKITAGEMAMVEAAEDFLKDLGFGLIRVRLHNGMARIEIGKDEMPKMMSNSIYQQVAAKLRALGFKIVTLDLEGYRSGSMDSRRG